VSFASKPALNLHALGKLLAPDRRDPASSTAFRANALACRQAAFDPARRPTDGAIMQWIVGVRIDVHAYDITAKSFILETIFAVQSR
jgi:hypothetical protein